MAPASAGVGDPYRLLQRVLPKSGTWLTAEGCRSHQYASLNLFQSRQPGTVDSHAPRSLHILRQGALGAVLTGRFPVTVPRFTTASRNRVPESIKYLAHVPIKKALVLSHTQHVHVAHLSNP